MRACFLAWALAATVLLLTEKLQSLWKPGLRSPSEHIHFSTSVSAIPHPYMKNYTKRTATDDPGPVCMCMYVYKTEIPIFVKKQIGKAIRIIAWQSVWLKINISDIYLKYLKTDTPRYRYVYPDNRYTIYIYMWCGQWQHAHSMIGSSKIKLLSFFQNNSGGKQPSICSEICF